MVFFLIVVRRSYKTLPHSSPTPRRRFCKFFLFAFAVQVIIKKFQIPYRLPVDEALNDSIKVLNATLSQLNATAVDYSEDACTPKYFVFNSQVRFHKAPLGGCISVAFQGPHLNALSRPADRVRCSDPDLCLRVPPLHPAHVRGAQRVSALPLSEPQAKNKSSRLT